MNRTRVLAVALAVFALNVWICRELFGADFIANLDSNEGAFVSISRFYREFGFLARWFPWFNCGMPIENAYQPLLPMAAALLGRATGWTSVHAFHFVLALTYCLGPVGLFWFVWDWSRSLAGAIVAAAVFSLSSPAQWLVPVLWVSAPARIFNIVRYAEDPHCVALALLPFALLALRRGWVLRSVLACSAVVLTNAFGAVDLAVAVLCIGIVQPGAWRRLLGCGIAAYCLMSPWMAPSLIRLMAGDQWGPGGGFRSGWALAAVGVLFLWFVWLSRRMGSFFRFGVLLGFVFAIIPLASFYWGIALVPQAHRYQLELEFGACILFAGAAIRLKTVPRVVVALAIAGLCWHGWRVRAAVHDLIRPIDIASTSQYRTDVWLRDHLRGERAMVGWDTEYLYNQLSDQPQLSGGHEPTVPNWNNRVAIYTFYVSAPQHALLWLKAFGAHAATMPVTEHKFDNLPLLWSDGTTKVLALPHRSEGLAHVVPASALVQRRPFNAMDVDPLRPYVAALENALLPVASLQGEDIRASGMRPDQVVSVQMNYVPGWTASVEGRPVPVGPDGIGLIVVRPSCHGDCHIVLRYGVSAEAWFCRVLSLLAGVFLLLHWRGVVRL